MYAADFRFVCTLLPGCYTARDIERCHRTKRKATSAELPRPGGDDRVGCVQ